MTLSLLVLLSIFRLSYAQFANCSSINTCSKCISTASCLWCSAVGSNVGCFSQDDDLKKDMCGQNNVGETVNTVLQVNNNELDKDNQVTLESLNVKLRVGEPLDFTVSVKAAEDFPLDIYMLMDLSGSFKNDLDVVKSLAPQLPLALQDVSSDFLIGFGSFVDKPSLPYVSSVQINGRVDFYYFHKSAIPFNYEHVVSLTNSSDNFNSSIQKTIISNNVDNPEDVLGAMLQAVVCKDLVGWREKSRKILLVMTDDVIHTAGDGRLAGIVKPNDGQCHTEYDPSYNKIVNTAAIMQDYPSIEQVKGALQNDNIVPVFAVVSPSTNLFNLYNKNVGPLLGGFTTILTDNSSNLIDVFKEAYLKIVSNIRLSFNLPNYLSASVTANCPPQSTYLSDYECSDVGNGTVNYTITLTLLQCTDNLKNGVSEQVLFNIPGFGQFTVNVNGICSCDCDNKTEYNSSICNNYGDLTCGLCTCDNRWTGSNANSDSHYSCPLGPNGIVCSGRGQCVCGECVCMQPTQPIPGIVNPTIVGNACECSNYECNTDSNGLVCSGRGRCACFNGQYSCQCDNSTLTGIQYSGDACQCSYDNCINLKGLICNGQGVCDPCQVNMGQACTCNTSYYGQYCNITLVATLGVVNDIYDEMDCFGETECIVCYGKADLDIEDVECSNLNCSKYKLLKKSVHDDYQIPHSIENTTIQCELWSNDCTYIYYQALDTNGENTFEVEPANCPVLPYWSIALITLILSIIFGLVSLFGIKICIIVVDYKTAPLLRTAKVVPAATSDDNEATSTFFSGGDTMKLQDRSTQLTN